MKNLKKSVLFSLLLLSTSFSDFSGPPDQLLLVGPRITYHLNGEGFLNNLGFGLEISKWYSGFFGFDVGIEFGKKRMVMYSEGQVGLGLLGTSLGPYINFLNPTKKIGIQSTTWVNFLLGGQYRYRSQEPIQKSSLGLYLTLPPDSWATFGDSSSNSSENKDFSDRFD